MGKNSGIEWTDHTFNAWRGCTKVSPGCTFCYAERGAKRNPKVLGTWGPKGKRRVAADAAWREVKAWNRKAAELDEPALVFTGSFCDVFESRKDLKATRSRLFNLIEETENLRWLVLTKRPENVKSMLMERRLTANRWPINAWLGVSIEDQLHAEDRIPELLRLKQHFGIPGVFLSCEPLLGPIELTKLELQSTGLDALRGIEENPFSAVVGRSEGPGVDWVIAGGESGGKARPSHPDWFRQIRDDCASAGVPFFFKQWGEWAPGECCNELPKRTERVAWWWNDEWIYGKITPKASESMHRDDAPDVYRVGKRNNEATLDGVEHKAFPF